MDPLLQEWLNLAVRWVHVIAAIMWIGDSFLFMWLDSSLRKPTRRIEGDVVGELWMAHSGGFYEVIKRRSLAVMPDELHWFKWESYTTWITGFLLLIIVYWLGGRAMLLDSASDVAHIGAVGLSFGILAGVTAIYHIVCKTPLIQHTKLFSALGLAAVVAGAWAMGTVFTPRSTFLQVGAVLGTIMTSNVFFVIIPAQKHMMESTKAGTPVDTSYGARAKQRSTHNHYLTLPVLFLMLSNHFPSLYGHEQAWLVLGMMSVVGVGVKIIMNRRRSTPAWILGGTVATLAGVIILTSPLGKPDINAMLRGMAPVSYATAEAIVQARCVTCHSAEPANPAYAAPPQGVMLDTPARIHDAADRMLINAVHNRTMPLGNLTDMTDDERSLLGAWIIQGADVNAPGPVQLEIAAPSATPAPSTFASPAEEAGYVYTTRCAMCHGEAGKGDGLAASALQPPPRTFADSTWQAQTKDADIAKAILQGGAAVGKAATMPPNPDLQEKPAVVDELVRKIRAFGP